MILKRMVIKSALQHRFNELHLYCRLRNIGMPHRLAKGIAQTISPKSLLYSKKK